MNPHIMNPHIINLNSRVRDPSLASGETIINYSMVKDANPFCIQIEMDGLQNIYQSVSKRAKTILFQLLNGEEKRYYLDRLQDKVSYLQNHNAIM